ncbi:MAG: ZIP family metal transporter [Gemmatimonadota bacterium]
MVERGPADTRAAAAEIRREPVGLRGPADAGAGPDPGPAGPASPGRGWLLGLGPLVLLAGLVALFLRFDPTGFLREAFPPVEELTIERVTFPAPGRMVVHVVNGGPEPVTIAQVQVDEAYWQHTVEPDRTVPRLGRVRVELAYPWVEGEPHQIGLVSSTGLTFAREVAVATLTPRTNARYFGTFALLGVYAGVVPVIIGLLWYPFLRDVSRRWLHFFLSLTIGLLVFLGVDSLHEALESAGRVPDAFQGVGLVILGVAGSMLALRSAGHARGSRWGRELDDRHTRLRLAYLIAIGIGLHNLGEGLAIGASFAVGEIALGSFLVIGFALHNTTEGLGIVAPVASDRPSLWHLGAMGGIAGIPTITGAWIGGFAYTPIFGALFLALGAGAIFQVVAELTRVIQRRAADGVFAPLNAAGLAVGLFIMYGTALLVVA